jgi:hypothetical protein
MKKDIDAILDSDALELTLGGTDYTVRDVSVETFLGFLAQRDKEPEEREDVRRQLEAAMGLKPKSLNHIGLRAATMAFDAINEWLRGAAKEVPEGGEADTESPPST